MVMRNILIGLCVFFLGVGANAYAQDTTVDLNAGSGFTVQDSRIPPNPILSAREDGNVGIGTASPANILDINSPNVNSFISLKNANSISNGVVIGTDGNQDFHIRNYEAGDIRLGHTLSPYVMVVKEDGNVGIGTMSPGAKLEVLQGSFGGSQSASSFKVGNTIACTA